VVQAKFAVPLVVPIWDKRNEPLPFSPPPMITCYRCANRNEDDHAYCGHCGARLDEPSRSGATVTAPESERPVWTADPVIGLRIRNTLTEFDLPVWRRETSIGRAKTCDVVLPSAAVSSVHCMIERREGGICVVHDRGSKNGILSERTHRRMFELSAGSLFMVGNVPMVAFSASMQGVRATLQYFLGFDERHQRGVEDALEAAGQRLHVLLAAPPGGQADRVAEILHGSGPGARQPFHVAPRIPAGRRAQRELFSAASNGTLVLGVDDVPGEIVVVRECLRSNAFNARVIAVGRDPASAVGSEMLEGSGPGHAVAVHIPALIERAETDRMKLVSILGEATARRLGVEPFSVSPYLGALLRHDWPNNLDELEETIERLLVLQREGGNQRAAARALGLSRGSWARWFQAFRQDGA